MPDLEERLTALETAAADTLAAIQRLNGATEELKATIEAATPASEPVTEPSYKLSEPEIKAAINGPEIEATKDD